MRDGAGHPELRESGSIAPGLLVAMPQLLDPNFAQTVVLMADHREDGSFGVVLNRPGRIPVVDLLKGFELSWAGDPAATVGYGGPVMSASGWLVHEPVAELEAQPGTMAITAEISISMSLTNLQWLAAHPPAHILFLMGYAGWGPGQLQAEIEGGSWLHAEATADLVFRTPADRMWAQAMRSIGVDPAIVVPTEGRN